MGRNLSELLALPTGRAGQSAATAATGETFSKQFRARIGELNRQLHEVAAQAAQPECEKLEAQRDKLFEVYHRTASRIVRVDPRQADNDMDRVFHAIQITADKAAKVSRDSAASHDRWLDVEGDFDDALVRVGELEAAGNAKAPVLRKLADAIRDRVHQRQYEGSITALQRLLPKLNEYYAEYQDQVAAEQDEASTDEARLAMWREMDDLEGRLDQILAEQGITL